MKKQDKALIHARRARNIITVLMDPKDTAIESAQFRYASTDPFSFQLSLSSMKNMREKFTCCQPKELSIKSPALKRDFRFWVKKMFKLQVVGIDVCASVPKSIPC